jgi:tRNA A37 threonylcarbamoyladenosine dehydratase
MNDEENQFSRTELLLDKSGIQKLKEAKVLVFGLGGVGSYVVEALARVGVGNFIIVDNDVVSESNINRQLIATHSTIGMNKVDVCKNRILDINPNANVEAIKEFFMPGSKSKIINNDVSYVIDCIDTVTAKIEIIVQCKHHGVPVISSMGTGNKLDPSKFEITDISKTSVCPLAKVMRKELKDRNIRSVKVLYSKEEPINPYGNIILVDKNIKRVPGSVSFVPSVAGLMIASEVVMDILGLKR